MPPQTHPDSPAKPRQAGRTALRLVVTGAILVLLFRKIPFHDVIATLHETRLGYVWAAFLTTLVVHAAASLRLQKLCALLHLDLSAREVFKINTAARFYGLFLPAGNFAAIAIRFYRLSAIRKQYGAAVVAMLGDRVLATISLCVVGGVFYIVERPQETLSHWRPAVLTLLALLAAAALVGWGKPVPLLEAFKTRIGPWASRNLAPSAASAHHRGKAWLPAIGLLFLMSLLIHVLGTFSYELLGAALGLKVSFTVMGWIRSAVILSTMLPVSVSGIGVREGAMVLLLGWYNVMPSDAVAFALMVFAVTVVGIGLVGGLFEASRLLISIARQPGVKRSG